MRRDEGGLILTAPPLVRAEVMRLRSALGRNEMALRLYIRDALGKGSTEEKVEEIVQRYMGRAAVEIAR